MPLYEYQCTACGRLTEKRQKFSDPELTDCPYCGGHLERTITAPAIQFKGGGWYADLYSSGKKPAPAGGTGESSPAAEAGKSTGESKSGESKSGESKSGESKSGGESSSTPSAPASTPAPSSSNPAKPS